MADKTVYVKTETTGGAANALDGVNGNSLVSTDKCLVYSSDNEALVSYELSSDGTTERPPFYIQPDTNSSSWSWKWMRSLDHIPQTLTTTGGTINPFGVTLINPTFGTTDNYTLTLGTPSSGIRKTIILFAGTSQIVRVITQSSGTELGVGDNQHIILHNSDPNIGRRKSPLMIDLMAASSTSWWVINQTSGARSFSSGIST